MTEISIDAQGRLAIPAKVRKQAGLKKGDRLVVTADAGVLTLAKREAVEQKLWDCMAGLKPEVDLLEELRKERRWEFEQEEKWMAE